MIAIIGEFTCPLCGSHYFATDGNGTPDTSTWTGRCKGRLSYNAVGSHSYAGCTFSWKRADDAKYFREPPVTFVSGLVKVR